MTSHFAAAIRRSAKPLQAPSQTAARWAGKPHRFIWAAALLLSGCMAALGLAPRPQDPQDRPYKVETVQFAGGPGVTLAGELTMPLTAGPHKAVVLISGSGPQGRDEALAGHRPFLVLSDHLTRAGYAVLRYDDRGYEESTGSYEDAALDDFAYDAAGAFRYLAGRREIVADGIGFLGSSEGGYIAPAAAQQVDPAFMVFLAGPARPFYDVLAAQNADILRAEGSDDAEINLAVTQIKEARAILAKPLSLSQIRDELNEYLKAQGLGRSKRQDVLDSFAIPWGVGYASYDPTSVLEGLSNPVLALFGEKDLQVSAKEEAPVMRAALKHPRSEVQVFPGLNHLFQPAQTGLPSEYAKIETTISVDVLNRISGWLDSH
jgi:fermentation-respiration switch protein FrsA (DUF1100 family)